MCPCARVRVCVCVCLARAVTHPVRPSVRQCIDHALTSLRKPPVRDGTRHPPLLRRSRFRCPALGVNCWRATSGPLLFYCLIYQFVIMLTVRGHPCTLRPAASLFAHPILRGRRTFTIRFSTKGSLVGLFLRAIFYSEEFPPPGTGRERFPPLILPPSHHPMGTMLGCSPISAMSNLKLWSFFSFGQTIIIFWYRSKVNDLTCDSWHKS